jgi:FKBP-type peptidyl-prolyl cis-trans isomerase
MRMSAAMVVTAGLLAVGCNSGGSSAKDEKKDSPKVEAKPAVKELTKEDVKAGTGREATEGDRVYVLYTGKLGDGTVFDSTERRANRPFSFVLGGKQVIEGWDKGVPGMKVGGTRNLSIPWSQAYGEAGSPPTIPAKSDLFFEITLLDVLKKGEEDIIDRTEITRGTGPAAKVGDRVAVHYTGTSVGGDEFDSTARRGDTPYAFTIGEGKVLPFFEFGVKGMQLGGKRKIRVPPAVGLGPGTGLVGPDEVVNYEIELVELNGKKAPKKAAPASAPAPAPAPAEKGN